MKTKEQVKSELDECLKMKITELETITGMKVSSIDVFIHDVVIFGEALTIIGTEIKYK